MPTLLEARILTTDAIILRWKNQTVLSSNRMTYNNTEVRFTVAVCRNFTYGFRRSPQSSCSSPFLV
jgi:hypothetical protein